MLNDIADLVAQARAGQCDGIDCDCRLLSKMADALEAQRARIKELADENWAAREEVRKAGVRIAHLEAWNTNLRDADDRWVVIVGEQNQEIVELEVRIAELEAERDAVLISDEDLLGAIASGSQPTSPAPRGDAVSPSDLAAIRDWSSRNRLPSRSAWYVADLLAEVDRLTAALECGGGA